MPYEIYHKLKFKIPYAINGDCYDRYLLRIEELRQSNKLMFQILNNIPKGKIKASNHKLSTPTKVEVKYTMEALIHHFKLYSSGLVITKNECYISVEAPKGEFGIYIVADNSEVPYRCKIKAPGFTHLQAINYLCRGYLIADVVTVIGTLDIVFGEVDR
jgi:NADH-quinone oxidoreductase subunit D